MLPEGKMTCLKQLRRLAFMGAVSPLAIAAPAIAQGVSAGQGVAVEAATETIVVTGARLQNQAVIAAKRETDAVADFVTADDIAQLPDFNVAEALRRIPGVSLQLDFRFDREGYVSVRGLNSTYNYTQLDGGSLSSTASNERSVLLDVIPSSVLTRAEVYKSFTPEMEGQAIGGYIALKSRSAFDTDGVFANFSGDYGFTENEGWEDKGPTFRLAGAAATTFGANDEFGFTFAGTYSQEDRYLYNPSVRTYYYFDAETGARLSSDAAVADGANAYPVARIDSQFAWRYDREFKGGLAKLEWKPTDDAYTFVQGFYYDFFERSDRQGVEWDWRATTRPLNQTPYSGLTEERVRVSPALVTWDTTNELWSIHGGGEYTLFESDTLTVNALYGVGSFSDPTKQYRTGFDAVAAGDKRLAYTYDFNGDWSNFPVRTLVDETAYNDLSLYGALPGHRYFGGTSEEDSFEAKADYRKPFDIGMGDLAVKAGVKVAAVKRTQDQDYVDYDLRAGVPRSEYNLGLFARDTDFRLPGGTHNYSLWITDQAAIQGYFDTNPENFVANAGTLGNAIVDDFDVEETVYSGYVQAEFEYGPFELTGGVRYEATEVESNGFRPSTDASDADGFAELSDSNAYDNWLPRLLLTYDLTRDLVAKAAYSKSVSRASYRDLRANRSTFRYDSVFGTASISGGNTDLEPRTSENFDVSLEYYPGWVDGLFSVAVFRKEIANEIATPSIRTSDVLITPNPDGSFTFGGDPANGAVFADLTESIPINLDAYTIDGVEVGTILNSFDFVHPALSFIGASANYTYVGADAVVTRAGGDQRKLPTMIGQPEHIANASIFAQFGKIEARLAYNYQSEYLFTLAGSPADDDIWNSRGIVSAQIRYNVTDNFVLLARSNNLTGEPIRSTNGFGAFTQERDSGTLHWIGFTYQY